MGLPNSADTKPVAPTAGAPAVAPSASSVLNAGSGAAKIKPQSFFGVDNIGGMDNGVVGNGGTSTEPTADGYLSTFDNKVGGSGISVGDVVGVLATPIGLEAGAATKAGLAASTAEKAEFALQEARNIASATKVAGDASKGLGDVVTSVRQIPSKIAKGFDYVSGLFDVCCWF